jgi:hypothetical protein
MIYRARKHASVHVEALGRDVTLDPAVPLDDSNPEDAEVIKRWAGSLLVADNIESASAAPGERRAGTRRTKPAA